MKHKLTDYDFPNELKNMSLEEMELLSYEIRDFLITNISKTGGHLASNLGVVELSLALHSYFDTPKDKIIWDVGHQSYVHKILTGRTKDFQNLRKLGGISGFPKRNESPHDVFDSGHSSNSISAAMGFAKARDLKGEDYQVISVIGDGALTGGPAFEGLNNLGVSRTKVIVVLNDNGMSIRPNTGAVSSHLNKLRVSKNYNRFKHGFGREVRDLPVMGKHIYNGVVKMRDILKYAIVDGIIFEELGFRYFGPIDGHDIKEIKEYLAMAKACEDPALIHVITQKGKGYRNAEMSPHSFHGIGPFDTISGNKIGGKSVPDNSRVFGEKLTEMAEHDERIAAVHAAMIDGTGLEVFGRTHPERIFDAGIAEAHAVTFAAGLALNGYRPFVAVYSTFLQRAYDQILMDVCLQNLPVVFAVDRAGIVGEDGETHHGNFDMSYFLSMPNLTVLAPADGNELKHMMDYAMTLDGPCAIRYPKGSSANICAGTTSFFPGSRVIREGKDLSLWGVGSMAAHCMEAAEILSSWGIDAKVVDPRFVKPIDEEALKKDLKRFPVLVTAEDNAVIGGMGEKIASFAQKNGYEGKVITLGWPDRFIEHGSKTDLYKKYGLDPGSIAQKVRDGCRGKENYDFEGKAI